MATSLTIIYALNVLCVNMHVHLSDTLPYHEDMDKYLVIYYPVSMEPVSKYFCYLLKYAF